MNYQYTVTTPLLTANAQRRMNFHDWSRMTREARQSSYVLAKEAKIPKLGRVHLILQPGQGGKRRLADPLGHSPIAKAVIDGLVDAGVIEDDRGEFVEAVTMFAPIRAERDCMIVTVEHLLPDDGQ